MDRQNAASRFDPIAIYARKYQEGIKPYQRSLITVLLSIFLIESVAMALTIWLNLPIFIEAILDPLLLVVVAYPLLNERFLKPLLRQYEAALQARHASETFANTSMELAQTLELARVFNILLDRIKILVQHDFSSLYLLESPSRLVVQVTRGYDRSETQPAAPLWFDPAENPIIQQIIRQAKGVAVPDIHAQPDWSHHRRMAQVRSWLGIPLVAGGKVIGLLGLGKREAHYYTADHLRYAEGLVGQAAVAIQNAWLFEQVSAGNEQLRILTRQLVEVQEFERAYIARELHDDVGQTLTSVIIDLKRLDQNAGDPAAVQALVAEMNNSLETLAENLHRLAANLHPAALDHIGLVPALRQYIDGLSERSAVQIHFSAQQIESRISKEMDTFLYRIVQEALTNVIRHAQAKNVDVVLQQHGGSLILIIEDDGLGFDVESSMHRGRLGLFGMRERAETLGGNLLIESSPGNGTTIRVEVPDALKDPDYG